MQTSNSEITATPAGIFPAKVDTVTRVLFIARPTTNAVISAASIRAEVCGFPGRFPVQNAFRVRPGDTPGTESGLIAAVVPTFRLAGTVGAAATGPDKETSRAAIRSTAPPMTVGAITAQPIPETCGAFVWSGSGAVPLASKAKLGDPINAASGWIVVAGPNSALVEVADTSNAAVTASTTVIKTVITAMTATR